MDGGYVASLKDYNNLLEKIFKNIEKKINEYQTAELSSQNILKGEITKDLSTVQNNISLMKMEHSSLKEENNKNEWKEIIQKLSENYEKYNNKFSKLQNKLIDDDELDIEKKVDLSQLSTQQVMNRGDKILKSDRNAINRMNKIVNQDIDTMKEVNKELNSQKEKLENAEKDLTEIDFSVKRAVQQLQTMFKMYATDKLIMCLIVVIILVIISIIIIKFVKDDDENVNKVNDVFSSAVSASNINKKKFIKF